MLSQISDLVETQQELGEEPAGMVLVIGETMACRAAWEVGTRTTIPQPTPVSALAPAPPVFDTDSSPSDNLLLPHTWHEDLAEHLPPPCHSGCAWFSIQVSGRASPGEVMDPECRCTAPLAMGTVPLTTLAWLMPKLVDPIHRASHTSDTPRHKPHMWTILSAL